MRGRRRGHVRLLVKPRGRFGGRACRRRRGPRQDARAVRVRAVLRPRMGAGAEPENQAGQRGGGRGAAEACDARRGRGRVDHAAGRAPAGAGRVLGVRVVHRVRGARVAHRVQVLRARPRHPAAGPGGRGGRRVPSRARGHAPEQRRRRRRRAPVGGAGHRMSRRRVHPPRAVRAHGHRGQRGGRAQRPGPVGRRVRPGRQPLGPDRGGLRGQPARLVAIGAQIGRTGGPRRLRGRGRGPANGPGVREYWRGRGRGSPVRAVRR